MLFTRIECFVFAVKMSKNNRKCERAQQKQIWNAERHLSAERLIFKVIEYRSIEINWKKKRISLVPIFTPSQLIYLLIVSFIYVHLQFKYYNSKRQFYLFFFFCLTPKCFVLCNIYIIFTNIRTTLTPSWSSPTEYIFSFNFNHFAVHFQNGNSTITLHFSILFACLFVYFGLFFTVYWKVNYCSSCVCECVLVKHTCTKNTWIIFFFHYHSSVHY